MKNGIGHVAGRGRLAMLARAGLVSAIIMLQAIGGVAASGGTAGRVGRATSVSNDRQARVVGSLPRPLAGGTHHVYVEDNWDPNGIDVFSVVGAKLTHIQHVPVAFGGNWDKGNHYLAIASGGHCLVFLSWFGGTVYSFVINSDGTLVTTPASSVYVGGLPNDVAVTGSTVIDNNLLGDPSNPTLDTLSIASGCALTLEHQTPTGGQADHNIAARGPYVFTADRNSGDLLAYKLGPGGTLTQTVSTPGQIVGPFSVAVWSGRGFTNFYTGQATFDPPQAQGDRFTLGGFRPVSGSPQTSSDPNTSNGIGVAVSPRNLLLVQASGSLFGEPQISWYTLTQTSMQYADDTSLSAYSDGDLVAVGDDLLVAGAATNVSGPGTVESCALAPTGVSGCHVIITVPGSSSGTSVAVK